jgi:hypothetical protein
MDSWDTECYDGNWDHLGQTRDQWAVLLNTIKNLKVP